jgi:tetratricopeptide (TPR) repeat protein
MNFEVEIRKCEKFLAEKSFKMADEAISNAIHVNRDSPYAWYLKAKVCVGLLNYKKALRASNKAVSIDQKNEYIKLKENIENFIGMQADGLVMDSYPNSMDNMAVFTTNRNIRLLSERKLNGIVYSNILDNIAEDMAEAASCEGDVFFKVKDLVESFIDLDFVANKNNSPRRVVGTYGFKRAAIDSNSSKTLQIGAMIHELAHHLLFEIFKNAIMFIYQSRSTDTIEAFGWYALIKNPYWLLMNEYCAHRVECNYIPYRNYESFNSVLQSSGDLDIERVKKAVELGDSLAGDIIGVLDGFFTEELREEIRMQFLSDRIILLKKGCEFESETDLADGEKFDMINSILRQTLMEIRINFSYGELNQFKEIFANVRG